MTPLQELAAAFRTAAEALDQAHEAAAAQYRDGVRLLTIEQTAGRLGGVDARTVTRLVAAGDLQPTRVTPTRRASRGPAKRGGRLMFHPDDVQACIDLLRSRSRTKTTRLIDVSAAGGAR